MTDREVARKRINQRLEAMGLPANAVQEKSIDNLQLPVIAMEYDRTKREAERTQEAGDQLLFRVWEIIYEEALRYREGVAMED